MLSFALPFFHLYTIFLLCIHKSSVFSRIHILCPFLAWLGYLKMMGGLLSGTGLRPPYGPSPFLVLLQWQCRCSPWLSVYLGMTRGGVPGMPRDILSVWPVLTELSPMALHLSSKMWVAAFRTLSQKALFPPLLGTGNANAKLTAHLFQVLPFVQVCQLAFPAGSHCSALRCYLSLHKTVSPWLSAP